jgi:hypothetical protein
MDLDDLREVPRRRVVTRAHGELFQLPLAGLFWDARGRWREARKASTPPRPRASSSQQTTFVTVSEARPQRERSKPQFPAMLPEPARSDTTILLQTGIQLMNTSKFIDRTVRPVDTFRGIGKPVNPPRVTVPKTAPTRKPNQFIQDVVNVIMGPDRFSFKGKNVLDQGFLSKFILALPWAYDCPTTAYLSIIEMTASILSRCDAEVEG